MRELLSDRWLQREEARMDLARLHLNDTESFESVLDRVLQISASALKVDRVGYWSLESQPTGLRCSRLFDVRSGIQRNPVFLPTADLDTYLNGFVDRRVMAIEDVRDHPLTVSLLSAYFKPNDIRATLDAPVYRNGSIVGIMCHERRSQPRVWSDDEADFSIQVAETVAQALVTHDLHTRDAALKKFEQAAQNTPILNDPSTFVRAIAHDVNNLLSALSLRAALVRHTVHNPEYVRDGVDKIQDLVTHAARLMQHLMSQTRRLPTAPECLMVDETLERMHGILESLAGDDRTLQMQLSAQHLATWIDPVHFEQIISNLVVNARDATRSGGVIRIETSVDDRGIAIAVSDNGHGMTEQVREQIFDRYFTTRGDRLHHGLGLATVQSIVQSLNGSVAVQSVPEQGSEFRIVLPPCPQSCR